MRSTSVRVWSTVGLIVAVIALVLPWAASPHLSAAAAPAPASPVRLSVSVERASYPREALVRVTVRMKNVSRRPILVGSAPAAGCAKVGPSAQVLSAQGDSVYPEAL